MSAIRITKGFEDSERPRVVALFWEAFGSILRLGLGPDEKALKFIGRVADPDYALCARDAQGALLGMQTALSQLKSEGRMDESGPVADFELRQETVQRDVFDKLEKRYST